MRSITLKISLSLFTSLFLSRTHSLSLCVSLSQSLSLSLSLTFCLFHSLSLPLFSLSLFLFLCSLSFFLCMSVSLPFTNSPSVQSCHMRFFLNSLLIKFSFTVCILLSYPVQTSTYHLSLTSQKLHYLLPG